MVFTSCLFQPQRVFRLLSITQRTKHHRASSIFSATDYDTNITGRGFLVMQLPSRRQTECSVYILSSRQIVHLFVLNAG